MKKLYGFFSLLWPFRLDKRKKIKIKLKLCIFIYQSFQCQRLLAAGTMNVKFISVAEYIEEKENKNVIGNNNSKLIVNETDFISVVKYFVSENLHRYIPAKQLDIIDFNKKKCLLYSFT